MDFFGFLRDTANSAFSTAMKLVPGIGPALDGIEMAQGAFETMEIIREHGDLLINFNKDASELTSVATALLPAAKRTDIIQAGLNAVIGMQVLCGWTNEPTRGEAYGDGGSRFNDVADTLESAMPTDDWRGSASEAYTAANHRQGERAKMMVDADYAVSGALSAEANAVNGTRRFLNNSATLMGNAILPALLAQALGGRYGKDASLAIEAAAVGVAIPACLVEMKQLSSFAAQNAHTVQKAVSLYEAVAATDYPTRM